MQLPPLLTSSASLSLSLLKKKKKGLGEMGFLVKAGFLLLAAMSILSTLQIGGSSRVPVFIERKFEKGRVAAEEIIFCNQKGYAVDSDSRGGLVENFMYKLSSGPSRKGPGN